MYIGYKISFEPCLISILRYGVNISNASKWSVLNDINTSSSFNKNNMSAIKIVSGTEYCHSENCR